jgi:hypothetical protein
MRIESPVLIFTLCIDFVPPVVTIVTKSVPANRALIPPPCVVTFVIFTCCVPTAVVLNNVVPTNVTLANVPIFTLDTDTRLVVVAPAVPVPSTASPPAGMSNAAPMQKDRRIDRDFMNFSLFNTPMRGRRVDKGGDKRTDMTVLRRPFPSRRTVCTMAAQDQETGK